MAAKSRSPEIPKALREEFGDPRFQFGPNRRFRRLSIMMGSVLLLLGGVFFVSSILFREDINAGGSFMFFMLGGGLWLIGFVATLVPLLMPKNWLFVCRGGLIRRLGKSWQSLRWDEIARFQDLSFSNSLVSTKQCRIVTTSGQEWGWISEYIDDYPKLVQVLKGCVEGELTHETA